MSRKTNATAKDPALEAGAIRITGNARRALNMTEIKTALDKHSSCDWGEVSADEWSRNDEAFKSGEVVMSQYLDGNGDPFQIITEADRSKTTVLLPCERILKRAC